MSGESLRLLNVRKHFPGNSKATIANFNLRVETGEFVVLLGPSGCGKSTLLRMIAGLTSPTSGEIILADRDITHLSPKERHVSMVFQNYALFPHMSVFENLAFGMRIRKVARSEIEREVKRAAAILQLDKELQRKPKELSGGQRQRVALGRAMVRKPKVFLFDEPLSNLDAKLRGQMRSEIIQFHRAVRGTSLYVTHDQMEAMTMADRIVVLDEGVIQQEGAPLDVFHHPKNLFVAGFLGAATMNFLPCHWAAQSEAVQVTCGEFAFTIPLASLSGSPPPSCNCSGTLGIRPEDICVKGLEHPEIKPGPSLPANVASIELLGDGLIAHCESKGIHFRARIRHGYGRIEKDSSLEMIFDLNKIYLFNEKGEELLGQ